MFHESFLLKEAHAKAAAFEREAAVRQALRGQVSSNPWRRRLALTLLAVAKRLNPEVGYQAMPKRMANGEL